MEPLPSHAKYDAVDKDDDLLSVGLTSCQSWRVRAQVFLNRLRIQFQFVYVISSSSDVYHLPEVSEDATLCGLRLAPIIINRPVTTSTLYLTEREPIDRRLCDDCARIDAARAEVRFSGSP